MKCKTKVYNETGFTIKDKVQYETLDDAISIAKKMNSKLQIGQKKVVGYKCDQCFKYHVGHNGGILKKMNVVSDINSKYAFIKLRDGGMVRIIK